MMTGGQYMNTVAVVAVPKGPRLHAGGLREGNLRAINRPNARTKIVLLSCKEAKLRPPALGQPEHVPATQSVDRINEAVGALFDRPCAHPKDVGYGIDTCGRKIINEQE